MVILNIQAVLGVYEAVCEGKPFIERVIAICGPSIKDNLHIKVRVGTPLKDILTGRVKTETPVRVVMNSLLTGFQLNDISLPVDRTFSHIIAIPEKRERESIA